MSFKSYMKKNANKILFLTAILILILIVIKSQMPIEPARTGLLGNFFGGINSINIVLILIGGGLIALAVLSGGIFAPLAVPGVIILAIGLFLMFGFGIIQNLLATTNPLVLLAAGALIIWIIFRPRQQTILGQTR